MLSEDEMANLTFENVRSKLYVMLSESPVA